MIHCRPRRVAAWLAVAASMLSMLATAQEMSDVTKFVPPNKQNDQPTDTRFVPAKTSPSASSPQVQAPQTPSAPTAKQPMP